MTVTGTTTTGGQAERSGRQMMQEFDDCRYRRDLAGFHVCWAASRVGIVTAVDCSRCSVPEALDEVDCHYLQAQVQLVPRTTAKWFCGAIGEPVNQQDPTDCSPCHDCERASPRHPVLG